MSKTEQLDDPLTLTIGHEQLVLRRRYEVASIFNDFVIAVFFFVGSILFLYPSMERAGVWCFIIGSFQIGIRPTIRLAAHIHLQRIPATQWEH